LNEEEDPGEMRPGTIFRSYGVNSAVVNEFHPDGMKVKADSIGQVG